jgi:hypothetical protein
MAGEQGAKGCLPALGFSDSAEGWVSEFGETSAHSSMAGGYPTILADGLYRFARVALHRRRRGCALFSQ